MTTAAPAPRRPGRRLGTALLGGMVGGVLVVAAWAWWAWTLAKPPAPPGAVIDTVRILPGMTLHRAADTLATRGLIRDPRVFRLGARLAGRDRDLHPGLFLVPVGAPARAVLRALVETAPMPIVVTVPEGLVATDVAQLVGDALGFPATDFLAEADDLVQHAVTSRGLAGGGALESAYAALIDTTRLPDGSALHWCEGYLAPDTYHFAEGIAAQTAARAVVSLQLARLDSAAALVPTSPVTAALSAHALLTLASIVEAETGRSGERSQVAAVYVNRLARGMRLEADPTVAFGVGKRGERLLYSDLRVASRYNTYLRPGLPPGPIDNPGWASIRAAARPDTTCRALYFVADGAGGHVFSRTLEGHRHAVARYRALRRQQR